MTNITGGPLKKALMAVGREPSNEHWVIKRTEKEEVGTRVSPTLQICLRPTIALRNLF